MEDRPFNDISFERFIGEDKLMGSRCKSCGRLYVPPRGLCVECGSSEMEWVPVKGDGTLAAFTCIAVGPPFMREEGYDRKRPYCTGVIKLDEGPKVVARIEEVDTLHPETIKVGMPMIAAFLHRGQGDQAKVHLVFRPK